MDKRGSWEDLKRRALERLGPKMVFGEGPLDAGLAVVGEAPGAQEEKAGRPFVGRAGKMLGRLLEDAGIERSEIYMTNLVKIRPTNESGGRLRNRPPRAGEIRGGLEILEEEIGIVAPSVLVLLGNVPARALVDRSFAMKAGRGSVLESRFGVPAIVTYHPAYLLRQRNSDLERIRELVLEDLGTARSSVRRPPG